MRIDVLTLFPEFIRDSAAIGVVGRAQERGLLEVVGWNPRDYATGNYRRVDERPFGGGPGMVMLIEPLQAALRAARAAASEPAHVIYLSPQGTRLTQAKVRELAARPRLILLCGRYEGVDERFIARQIDEEISIGDYVLSGGEPAATACSIARTTPGPRSRAENRCPQCCCPATMPRSGAGAASSRSAGPGCGGRTCWRGSN
jgi:tRNA (guanine37-N1)-methyltransferase